MPVTPSTSGNINMTGNNIRFSAAPTTRVVYTPENVSNSNLIAWFDGKDIHGDGTTPSAGSAVSIWRNKGSSTVKATGVNSPTYVSGGGVELNGSNQTFQLSIPYEKTNTIFIVLTSTTGDSHVLSTNPPDNPTTILRGYEHGFSLFPWHPANDLQLPFVAESSATSPSLLATTRALGTNVSGYYNGASVFSQGDTPNLDNATTWAYLGSIDGGQSMLQGTIYEVIIYNTVLTTSERQQIEGYLAWKWGMQGNLSSSNPYSPNASPPATGAPMTPSIVSMGNISVTNENLTINATNNLVLSGISESSQTTALTYDKTTGVVSYSDTSFGTLNWNQDYSTSSLAAPSSGQIYSYNNNLYTPTNFTTLPLELPPNKILYKDTFQNVHQDLYSTIPAPFSAAVVTTGYTIDPTYASLYTTGTTYIFDVSNQQIIKIAKSFNTSDNIYNNNGLTPSYYKTTYVTQSAGGFSDSVSLVVDNIGSFLYALDSKNQQITAIYIAASPVIAFTIPLSNYPITETSGITIDALGQNLYITDGVDSLYKVNISTKEITLLVASLCNPQGLIFDNTYTALTIVETGGNCVSQYNVSSPVISKIYTAQWNWVDTTPPFGDPGTNLFYEITPNTITQQWYYQIDPNSITSFTGSGDTWLCDIANTSGFPAETVYGGIQFAGIGAVDSNNLDNAIVPNPFLTTTARIASIVSGTQLSIVFSSPITGVTPVLNSATIYVPASLPQVNNDVELYISKTNLTYNGITFLNKMIRYSAINGSYLVYSTGNSAVSRKISITSVTNNDPYYTIVGKILATTANIFTEQTINFNVWGAAQTSIVGSYVSQWIYQSGASAPNTNNFSEIDTTNTPPQIYDSIQLWVHNTNLTDNITNIINLLQQSKSVKGTTLSWASLDKTVYRTMRVESVVGASPGYLITGIVVSTSGNSFTGSEPLVNFSVQGNVDGTAHNALFNDPTNITVDINNNQWVSDTGNRSIRSIMPKNIVSTLNTVTDAPHGISIDSFLNVYVASSTNIVQITPLGIKTTIATGSATLGTLSLQTKSDVSPYGSINGWPNIGYWVINGAYFPTKYANSGYAPILLPYVPNIMFEVGYSYVIPSVLYIQLMITSNPGKLPSATGNYINYVSVTSTNIALVLNNITIFNVLYSDIKELNKSSLTRGDILRFYIVGNTLTACVLKSGTTQYVLQTINLDIINAALSTTYTFKVNNLFFPILLSSSQWGENIAPITGYTSITAYSLPVFERMTNRSAITEVYTHWEKIYNPSITYTLGSIVQSNKLLYTLTNLVNNALLDRTINTPIYESYFKCITGTGNYNTFNANALLGRSISDSTNNTPGLNTGFQQGFYLTIDSSTGKLYVVDAGTNILLIDNLETTPTVTFLTNGTSVYSAILYYNGYLYETALNNHGQCWRVDKVMTTSPYSQTNLMYVDSIPEGIPYTSLASDSSGNMYRCQTKTGIAFVLEADVSAFTSQTGIVQPSATPSFCDGYFSDNTTAPNYTCWAMAIGTDKTIYFVDGKNSAVRKFVYLDSTGGIPRYNQLITIAGGGIPAVRNSDGSITAGANQSRGVSGYRDNTGVFALFNFSGLVGSGIVLDNESPPNIYVSDTGNSVIRKINSSTGVVTTIAGVYGVPGLTDGINGVSLLISPQSIVYYPTNNSLYVIDSGSGTIKSIELSSGNYNAIIIVGNKTVINDSYSLDKTTLKISNVNAVYLPSGIFFRNESYSWSSFYYTSEKSGSIIEVTLADPVPSIQRWWIDIWASAGGATYISVYYSTIYYYNGSTNSTYTYTNNFTFQQNDTVRIIKQVNNIYVQAIRGNVVYNIAGFGSDQPFYNPSGYEQTIIFRGRSGYDFYPTINHLIEYPLPVWDLLLTDPSSSATENTMVAVGQGVNKILVSNNGLSWLPTGGARFGIAGYGVAYNGVTWIAVGQDNAVNAGQGNTILQSYNGTTWSTVSGTKFYGGSVPNRGNAIATNGSMWMAVGVGAYPIITSTDNFTTSVMTANNNVITTGLTVAWNGSYWLVGGIGSTSIQKSADGMNWIPATSGAFTTQCNGLAWNGSNWVAVGQNTSGSNTIATSTDGLVWTQVSGFTTAGNGVAWNGYMWVAVGKGTNTIVTSLNGTAWTAIGNVFTISGNGISWNGDVWVAVGTDSAGNSIYTSSDGVTWTAVHGYPFTQTTDGINVANIYVGNGVSRREIVWDVIGATNELVLSGKYLGIGTSNPTYPLDVTGTPVPYGGSSYIFSTNPPDYTPSNGLSYIGRIDGGLLANNYGSVSDERIKKNISSMNLGYALEELRHITPMTYNYIDTLARGSNTVMGFIAQQVAQEIPIAVTTTSNFVPNIYSRINVSSIQTVGDTSHIYVSMKDSENSAMSTLSSTDVLSVYLPNACNIITTGSTTLDDMLILHTKSLLTDNLSSSAAFVYGKQVNDFNTLNKDYLYTINFAATKDLDVMVQQQQSTIVGLTAMLQTVCSTLGISM